MFGRKKKRPLFGAGITPDCSYCARSYAGPEGDALCALRRDMRADNCRRYQYDPLRREPKTPRPLQGHDPDDFTL